MNPETAIKQLEGYLEVTHDIPSHHLHDAVRLGKEALEEEITRRARYPWAKFIPLPSETRK